MENDSKKDKTVFETQIAGMSFKLRTAHNEETVNELVDFVNNKFQQALKGTKSGSVANAIVLASLNIAEEYMILKKKASLELDNLLEETQKISSDLELAHCSQNEQDKVLETDQSESNNNSFASC